MKEKHILLITFSKTEEMSSSVTVGSAVICKMFNITADILFSEMTVLSWPTR